MKPILIIMDSLWSKISWSLYFFMYVKLTASRGDMKKLDEIFLRNLSSTAIVDMLRAF